MTKIAGRTVGGEIIERMSPDKEVPELTLDLPDEPYGLEADDLPFCVGGCIVRRSGQTAGDALWR